MRYLLLNVSFNKTLSFVSTTIFGVMLIYIFINLG
uniref:Uncharacterized protein n=1 Tax=Anguilla anguilla TaxID=7936 RepID=A0A0E9VY14_ANGAN